MTHWGAASEIKHTANPRHDARPPACPDPGWKKPPTLSSQKHRLPTSPTCQKFLGDRSARSDHPTLMDRNVSFLTLLLFLYRHHKPWG